MEVVQHEDEWPRLCEVLEQRAHRTVTAIALMLERHLARSRERRKRREDLRELRAHVLVQAGQATRIEPPQILVERIHEDRERQVSLELRRGADEDEPPARVGATGELGEQTGLADPRLPYELDRGGASLIDLGEDLIQRTALLGAAHEVVG